MPEPVLNAVNEVAVGAFLDASIPFNRIAILIEEALSAFNPPDSFELDSALEIDTWSRSWCRENLYYSKLN